MSKGFENLLGIMNDFGYTEEEVREIIEPEITKRVVTAFRYAARLIGSLESPDTPVERLNMYADEIEKGGLKDE